MTLRIQYAQRLQDSTPLCTTVLVLVNTVVASSTCFEYLATGYYVLAPPLITLLSLHIPHIFDTSAFISGPLITAVRQERGRQAERTPFESQLFISRAQNVALQLTWLAASPWYGLKWMPGSVALYAPGKLRLPLGVKLPPPVTSSHIRSQHTLVSHRVKYSTLR